jgi:hypothetical protein
MIVSNWHFMPCGMDWQNRERTKGSVEPGFRSEAVSLLPSMTSSDVLVLSYESLREEILL